jgi:hypothetical protein
MNWTPISTPVRGSLLPTIGMIALTAVIACTSSSTGGSTDAAASGPDGPVADLGTSQPDGPVADVGTSATCGGGASPVFPCCYFWAPAGIDAGAGACRADSCVFNGTLADGGPAGAVICPAGYGSAVYCPTPLGGCGGPPTCCKPAP